MSKYEIYERLFRYHTYEEYQKYCLFNLLHHRHYKPFNCALIMAQRPGATFVQTARAWERAGCAVKPEAVPIVIMQVNGPVTLVYDREDVCSTAPEIKAVSSFEPDAESVQEIRRMIDPLLLTNWTGLVCRKGIRVAEGRFGEGLQGTAEALEHPLPVSYTDTAGGLYQEKTVTAYHQITLNASLNPHEKALTLLHELGHLYCGHVSGKRTKKNGLPEYRFTQTEQKLSAADAELDSIRAYLREHEEQEAEYKRYSERYKAIGAAKNALLKQWENKKEYEAQMVCKLLCERNGFADDTSDAYLRAHTENGMLPDISLPHVLEAAERIAGILDI